MEERLPRKLAAVLYADIAGYSRLTGEDEDATHRTLSTYLDLMTEAIQSHHGNVAHYAGDAVLADFGTVSDALACAAEVQCDLRKRNQDLPDDRKIQFRIGVNLGEVIVDRDDIYGDGVNVAARLESLAEPGGICISESVRAAIGKKLPLDYEFMGEQEVKNIAEPVRAYQVLLDLGTSADKSSTEKPVLELPAKPSIAVLPFTNMSGDSEQEYFSDGITEDIITELSRFSSIFVIARNSTFAYKGKAVKVQVVGKNLGVQYVVEGSVRKAGNRVRVTCQLIDAATGNHLWAQRYDHDLQDIFAVQDDVTRSIVAALPRRVEAADLERIKRKPTQSMAAYDYLLRGQDYRHRGSKEDNALSLRMLEKAIELDPEYAQAYALLACTLGQRCIRGYSEDPEKAWNALIEAAEKARALDDDDCDCHRVLGSVHMIQGTLDRAELHHEKAFALNPNDPRIVCQRGELLTWLGKPEEGVQWIEQAMRLDPCAADEHAGSLGIALHAAHRDSDAIAAFKRVAKPSHSHHAYLAACCAELGKKEDAKAHAAQVLRMKPDFSIDNYIRTLPYKNEADRGHYRDSLRKAGLPE